MNDILILLLSLFFLFHLTNCTAVVVPLATSHSKRLVTLQQQQQRRINILRDDVSSSSSSSSQAKCPQIDSITSDGPSLNGDDPMDPNNHRFNEISGMAFSNTQVGPSGESILYVINDGPTGRLGVYDSGSGRRLRTFDLTLVIPTTSMRDWEDMTYGSCGYIPKEETMDTKNSTSTKDNVYTTEFCIYIGDTGDNVARAVQGKVTGRNDEQPYRIIKIQEPIWDQYEDNESLPSSIITTLSFNYWHPESPTKYADCEAMFLDYNTGDLYLLPKWDLPESRTWNRLFFIPADTWKTTQRDEEIFSVIPIHLVADASSLSTNSSSFSTMSIANRTWTRADMSSDGSLVTLGTYDNSYLFIRCSPEESVADIFQRRRCRQWDNLLIKDARQFESIAFTPDGSRVLQLSECRPKCDPPMIWTTFEYSTKPSITCITQDSQMTSSPSLSSSSKNSSPVSIPLSSNSETPSPVPMDQTFSPIQLMEPNGTTTNSTSCGMTWTINIIRTLGMGWLFLFSINLW